MQKEKIQKVAVLMATYNGSQWLSEQLKSILNQDGVDVKLIVSDDMSTDGTLHLLEKLVGGDSRVTILPSKTKFGSAARNFYRLMTDADIDDCDYIAFADQDDIWLKNKLHLLASTAKEADADGVSSNVVAFWPDGSRSLVDKVGTLRKLDFLFECAGPGCTFLMTPWLIEKVKNMLLDPQTKTNQLKAHDWLMYAVCRASGRRWVISQTPTVEYRQHANNELGVHKGFIARLNRLQRLHSGWYKAEVIKTSQLCLKLTKDAYVKQACEVVLGHGVFHRIKLLKFVNEYRRSTIERIFFGLAILFSFYK